MTDTSLPSQSSSVPVPGSPSYVDTYAPPVTSTTSVQTAPAVSAVPADPVVPVASTVPVPTASSQPASTTGASDPLEELEKALQEYEERQKQLAEQKQAAVQKTQQVIQKDDGEDPLAELERVLDEYEAQYKKDDVQPQSEPADPTAPSDSSPAPLAPPASAPSAHSAPSGEAIEEQNIFELLGVMDAKPAEKEAFLDELQEALWEDFLDKDVSLLVTPEQLKEIQNLRAQTTLPENTRQEKLIAKVESLVPDIEEIMLEKALELKEDMVRERIVGLKEYYAAQPDALKKIQDAQQHFDAGRWKSGAMLLNSLAA